MSNEPRPAEMAAEVLRLAEQASGAHDVMDRAENPTEYETAIAAYYEHQRVYKQTAFDTAPILAAECLRLLNALEAAERDVAALIAREDALVEAFRIEFSGSKQWAAIAAIIAAHDARRKGATP